MADLKELIRLFVCGVKGHSWKKTYVKDRTRIYPVLVEKKICERCGSEKKMNNV